MVGIEAPAVNVNVVVRMEALDVNVNVNVDVRVREARAMAMRPMGSVGAATATEETYSNASRCSLRSPKRRLHWHHPSPNGSRHRLESHRSLGKPRRESHIGHSNPHPNLACGAARAAERAQAALWAARAATKGAREERALMGRWRSRST